MDFYTEHDYFTRRPNFLCAIETGHAKLSSQKHMTNETLHILQQTDKLKC